MCLIHDVLEQTNNYMCNGFETSNAFLPHPPYLTRNDAYTRFTIVPAASRATDCGGDKGNMVTFTPASEVWTLGYDQFDGICWYELCYDEHHHYIIVVMLDRPFCHRPR